MSRATVLVAALALSACTPGITPPPPFVADQCMRRELFKECLAAVPDGPKAAHYNDWSEVVTACEDAAYYQSLMSPAQVRAECK